MKGDQEFQGSVMANAFAEHFKSVYSKDPPLLNNNNAAFNTKGASKFDLGIHSAFGADGLSAIYNK